MAWIGPMYSERNQTLSLILPYFGHQREKRKRGRPKFTRRRTIEGEVKRWETFLGDSEASGPRWTGPEASSC